MRLFLVFLLMFSVTNIVAQEELVLQAIGLGKKTDQEGPAAKVSDKLVNRGCDSPRSSMKTLIYGDELDVIKCFQRGRFDITELVDYADKLQKIFRAQGVVIDLEKIPDDTDYKTAEKKESKYVISSRIPQIYLTRINGQWIFPLEVVEAIDPLYTQATFIDLETLYKSAPKWTKENFLGIEGLSIVQIAMLLALILLGLIIRLIANFIVIRQMSRILARVGMHHFEQLLKKASMPIGNLLMAGVLAIFVPSLGLNVNITNILIIAVRIAAALSGVVLAYRSVDVFAHYLSQKAQSTDSKLDDQLVPLFRRGLKITISIVGGIFILQNLNVDVTSLLAGVTIGGLAFSFAARDTVANLFGSITIFADKPFTVGDWVKAAGVEGIVVQVGFRSTRIRTFYNSIVSVPNSKFTDSVVDNLGLREYRRCLATIGVQYSTTPDQIEAFCNGIRAIIKAHPQTRKDYYEIHFSGYGDFSLNIMLYFFMKVPSWSDELRVRHEIYLDILRLAKNMGIGFAFPTQTLHVETLATQKEIKPKPIPSTDDLRNAAEYFSPGGKEVIKPGPRVGRAYFANDE